MEDSGVAVDPSIAALLGLPGSFNFFLSEIGVTVSNTNSYQVVVTRDGVPFVTLVVTSPGGQEVVSSAADATPPATGGVLIDFDVNPLTNPPSSLFPDVNSGTYTHLVSGLSQAGQSPFSVNAAVIAKNDSDLNTGQVTFRVYLVGDFAQSNLTAVNSALSTAAAIYAQRGIAVSTSIVNIASPNGAIPDPASGSEFYLANINNDPVVNIFIGETITAADNFGLLLGRSGGAPGAQVATSKSVVGVDLLNHAGPNAVFNGAEIVVLGSTIAHEAGHFLGLFHPVEIGTIGGSLESTTFVLGDTLTDTPACSTGAQCISNGAITNLMFPLSDPNYVQQDLTGQQGLVMNLQPVVN